MVALARLAMRSARPAQEPAGRGGEHDIAEVDHGDDQEHGDDELEPGERGDAGEIDDARQQRQGKRHDLRVAERDRSDALAAIDGTASDLHDARIMYKRTLRGFDELCLTSVRPMSAADIRALRARERVS
jgi:hypothetical protein